MSLKKKIILSFFLSAFLIAILAVFEYVNFIAIKKEIRFLELTDTVRSKSLQLRRHEKNFFLYSPRAADEESASIRNYLFELDEILTGALSGAREEVIQSLRRSVGEYRHGFARIASTLLDVSVSLRTRRDSSGTAARFFPLLEGAVYERPHQAAEFLQTVYGMPADHPVVGQLNGLDEDINALRKCGEDILTNSKELDRLARVTVERHISASQAAIVIVFPLFLASGMIMLFLISRNVVMKLGRLSEVVERTGKGQYSHVAVLPDQAGNDEVGILIRKFDHMEDELAAREQELERKNRELLQSRKLAAIGTLASGVAHELNNPLSNISLSAQVLMRELGDSASATVREVAGDILGQTARVKKIVSELLEFARGREPQLREVDLTELIRLSFERVKPAAGAVSFALDAQGDGAALRADPDQIEQVFINLFTNAIDAMHGRGKLFVIVLASPTHVQVRVSDTGKGMPPEALEKIFEPFFTTKERGTGLGLAIVFNIIRKHGGDITAVSEEGKGTTFVINLPRKNTVDVERHVSNTDY
jgi:two-component system, NtrC family, sensor kinase